MFDALYIGATGMRGEQMQIDAIANNVANLNTVGYRRSSVSFAELASAHGSESAKGADPVNAQTLAVGAGALPTLSMSTLGGALKQTNDPMNLAIDGVGYIEVIRADGSPAYTRAGQLQINADQLLATADGSPLAGRIQIAADAHDLRIAADGQVTAILGDRTEASDIGRIDVVAFANPAGLQPLGDGLYQTTAQSGAPQTIEMGEHSFGALRQGFLEGSNVQMTDELVTLMLAQRAFELNSKIVQAADQMLAITNGLYK